MGSTVALQGWGPGFESDLGPQLHVLPGFLWFPPELKKPIGSLIGFLWIWPQVRYGALRTDVRDCNLCIGARLCYIWEMNRLVLPILTNI